MDNVYQLHDYSKDTRPFSNDKKYEDMWFKRVNAARRSYGMTRPDAEATTCINFNLRHAAVEMEKLLVKIGFYKQDIINQCPFIFQDSDRWKYAYDVLQDKADPVAYANKIRKRRQRVRVQFPQSDEDYKCKDNPSFQSPYKSHSRINCVICAVEQRLMKRKIHNDAERNKREKLLNELKQAKDSVTLYDQCEQTIECTTPRKCSIDLNKCKLKDAMVYKIRFWRQRRFVRIKGTRRILHTYWSKRKDYCKLLLNFNVLRPKILQFLKGAKFEKKINTCPGPRHINVGGENVVDVHVRTDATRLQFEISAERKSDIFLSDKNINFQKLKNGKGIVSVVYDCTKNGFAHDRCQKSFEFPSCKSERTVNTVKVSDEDGALMGECTVWVKGASYGLRCGSSRGRRKLLQGGSIGGGS